MIPEKVIEEVLSKADIETVVGKYVTFTKRSGQNLFGLCPFHSEKTPSFSVSPSKGIYRCFGCGKGGNVINFIKDVERLSYPEAIKFLGEQYGVNVVDDNDYRSREDDSLKKTKERVRALLKDAGNFYFSCLNSEEGKVARIYARKRELTAETVKKFGLGYAPNSWDSLVNFLTSKGYTQEEMRGSGLFSVSKNGNLIDLFRGRLVFPIYDVFGKIVAFGGRTLGDDKAKYINSPDSLVYKKQEHLYALNVAKSSKTDQLIIAEGYMDVISMHQAGIDNAVAALGTAFTDKQLRLASKYADEIVFFFDSDNAGKNAALRAIRMMLDYLKKMSGMKERIRIKIACVPDGKDPDEYIKNNGAESFRAVVSAAKDLDDYLMTRAYDDNCDASGKLDLYRYQEDIIRYGSWVRDDLKREKMASNAASYLGANYMTVLNRMNDMMDSADREQEDVSLREIERENRKEIEKRAEAEKKEKEPEKKSKYGPDIVFMQELKLLVYAVRLNRSLADKEIIDIHDVLRPGDFTGENMKKIVDSMLKNFDVETGINEALLISDMSQLLLNGTKAEELYLKACSEIKEDRDDQVLKDNYLITLYDIRLKKLDITEKALMKRYMNASPEEKAQLRGKMNKIEKYRDVLNDKRSKL